MLEDGASQFYDFWGKEDGTFRNTKIFRAKYKIYPFDGAFFQVDPVERGIDGTVHLDFEVIPFAKVDANIGKIGSSIRATLTSNKAAGAGNAQDVKILVTNWNTNLGTNKNKKN